MAIIGGVEYRSKDLEKLDIPWEEREVIFKFDDDWTIEWVRTPNDLETEGGIMGHCAAQHAYWVHKGVEILFSLRNPHGTSKATAHAKPVKYWAKPQPEDELVNDYGGYYDDYYDRRNGVSEDEIEARRAKARADQAEREKKREATFKGLACGYRSTTYESYRQLDEHPQFELNGEQIGIIATSFRYGGSAKEYAERMRDFYVEMGVEPTLVEKHLAYYLDNQARF